MVCLFVSTIREWGYCNMLLVNKRFLNVKENKIHLLVRADKMGVNVFHYCLIQCNDGKFSAFIYEEPVYLHDIESSKFVDSLPDGGAYDIQKAETFEEVLFKVFKYFGKGSIEVGKEYIGLVNSCKEAIELFCYDLMSDYALFIISDKSFTGDNLKNYFVPTTV